MRDIYFWSVISGFLLGIAAQFLLPMHAALGVFFTVIAGSLFFIVPKNKHYIIASAAFFICAFLLGGLRTYVEQTNIPHALDEYIGQKVILNGTIVSEPDERERTVRLIVKSESLIIDDKKVQGTGVRILSSVKRPFSGAYGDIVTLEGGLAKPERFSSDEGREFNYPAFLAKDDVYYVLSFPEVVSYKLSDSFSIKKSLYAIKAKYLEGLSLTLPEPHAALAGGITVGDKRALGGALLDIFRITGIVHIVVLSGYNITIVVESIRRVLMRFFAQRVALTVSALAILAFVVMTGASSTGVRAGAMASLALIAQVTERRYAITRALAVTAVLMTLWSPHILLYDPGFQLSVIATLGLIHIAPLIERRLLWVTERLGIRGIVAATIGTQIAVLPLLLYQTGLLSLVALPVNLLVLPTIPIAMLFSFIAGLLGAIFSMTSVILDAPAYALLSYSLLVVEIFGNIPFAAVSIEKFSVWFVFIAYGIMFAVWFWMRKKI